MERYLSCVRPGLLPNRHAAMLLGKAGRKRKGTRGGRGGHGRDGRSPLTLMAGNVVRHADRGGVL